MGRFLVRDYDEGLGIGRLFRRWFQEAEMRVWRMGVGSKHPCFSPDWSSGVSRDVAPWYFYGRILRVKQLLTAPEKSLRQEAERLVTCPGWRLGEQGVGRRCLCYLSMSLNHCRCGCNQGWTKKMWWRAQKAPTTLGIFIQAIGKRG